MNTNKKTTRILQDVKINVKMKLSGLWVAVMLLYIYGDIFGFYKPGHIEEVIAEEVPLGSQISLVGAAVLMAIPAIMVFLSLTLKPKANRWTNIILGIIYTGVMIFTIFLPGAWAYYILLGIVEIVLTVLIVWYAWKWPKQEA